jgi:hypothetical protein
VLRLRLLIRLLCKLLLSLLLRLESKPLFGLLFRLLFKFRSKLLSLLESLLRLWLHLHHRHKRYHLKRKIVLSWRRKFHLYNIRIGGRRFVRMPLNVQHNDRARSNPEEVIVLRVLQQHQITMERLAEKRVSKFKLKIPSYTNKWTAIESRVARIKARVAELTGNMENSGATPGNRSPAQNRWQ